jgi:hypothetical protein
MSSYQYSAVRPHHRKSKKRLLIVTALLIGGAVSVAGVLLAKTSSGSSQGTVSNVTLTAPSLLPTFDPTPVVFNSSYVSFMYPKSLQPGSGGSVGGTSLASYVYVFRDTESWKLAIGISQLQTASLLSDSSYVYRTEHPDLYTQSTTTLDGKTYTIMTDTTTSGFDELAFTLHGSKVAEISLYGGDESGNTDLQTTFNMILSSWVWH